MKGVGGVASQSEALTGLLGLMRADWAAATVLFRDLVSASAVDPRVAQWIEQGWAVYGGPQRRSELGSRLARARRGDPDAAMFFAQVLFGTGAQTPAVTLARDTAQRHGGSTEAAALLCALLLRSNDPEAQAVLDQALATWPARAEGWAEIGLTLEKLGKREAARVCFARARPSFDLALQQGLIARDLGRLEEARGFFAEAVRFDPRSSRAWFLLGTCAQDLHDHTTAQSAYRSVLALDPGRAEAAVNLGISLQDSGDLAGAKAAYARAAASRADTFGRIAQALATAPKGELWLDLPALRRSLVGKP